MPPAYRTGPGREPWRGAGRGLLVVQRLGIERDDRPLKGGLMVCAAPQIAPRCALAVVHFLVEHHVLDDGHCVQQVEQLVEACGTLADIALACERREDDTAKAPTHVGVPLTGLSTGKRYRNSRMRVCALCLHVRGDVRYIRYTILPTHYTSWEMLFFKVLTTANPSRQSFISRREKPKTGQLGFTTARVA